MIVREKLNFGGTIVTVTVVETGWLHAELEAGVVVIDGCEEVVVEGRIGWEAEPTASAALNALPLVDRTTALYLPAFAKLTVRTAVEPRRSIGVDFPPTAKA
jgi:hypothetical protein